MRWRPKQQSLNRSISARATALLLSWHWKATKDPETRRDMSSKFTEAGAGDLSANKFQLRVFGWHFTATDPGPWWQNREATRVSYTTHSSRVSWEASRWTIELVAYISQNHSIRTRWWDGQWTSLTASCLGQGRQYSGGSQDQTIRAGVEQVYYCFLLNIQRHHLIDMDLASW